MEIKTWTGELHRVSRGKDGEITRARHDTEKVFDWGDAFELWRWRWEWWWWEGRVVTILFGIACVLVS